MFSIHVRFAKFGAGGSRWRGPMDEVARCFGPSLLVRSIRGRSSAWSLCL